MPPEVGGWAPSTVCRRCPPYARRKKSSARCHASAASLERWAGRSGAWTKPWSAAIRLKQVQAKIYEFACHEGNQDAMLSILAGARADEKARLR